ncbi:MAG: DUF4288 domain-containing protein [Nitrospirota bacterium]
MAWYSVRILFEVKQGRSEPVRRRLYFDSIIIVKANNEKIAEKRGLKYARANMETSYKNYRGETVSWKVKKFMEACDIFGEKIKEFTEVYSCYYRGWYPKPVARSSAKRIMKK